MNTSDRKTASFIVSGKLEHMTMGGFQSGYTTSEFIDFIRHCFPTARDIEIRDIK